MSRFLCAIALAFAANSVAVAQHWTIENFAGTGIAGFSGDGGPATKAQLNNPFGVVRGPDGAIWFCEYSGQRVRRIASDGTITTIAGNGKTGYSGDGGLAIDASFNLPHEIRFDRQGNLYVVDMSNHAIRKIDLKTGLISTLAGTGKPGATPDGAPLAGTPLKGPRSLDFDKVGNLWLATREGNQVFKIDMQSKTIHHIAGTGKSGFEGNGGPAKLANLKGPKGIALDASGNVWLADTESHSVRMVEVATGKLLLIAGTGEKGDGPVGNPLQCQLARLHGIFVDSDGSVFIGDSESHRVRVLRRK